MPKFLMTSTMAQNVITAKVGSAAGDVHKEVDLHRFKKLVGASRYNDCVAGDLIEGILENLNVATEDGFYIGGIRVNDAIKVTLFGLQATEGVGTVAVGDFVVAGTPTGRGVTQAGHPKVLKATDQAGTRNSPFCWRVVDFISGTGAVGSTAVIRRAVG